MATELSVVQLQSNVEALRKQIPALDAASRRASADDVAARRALEKLQAEMAALVKLDPLKASIDALMQADERRPALAAEIRAASQHAASAETARAEAVKRRADMDVSIAKMEDRVREAKLQVVELKKQIAKAEATLDQTALPRDQRTDALKLKVERLSKEGGLRDMRARLAHLQGA